MSRSLLPALMLLFSLCLAYGMDINTEGVEVDDKGHSFVMAHGEKWVLLGDSSEKFFLNERTKAMSFSDPRLSSKEQLEDLKDGPFKSLKQNADAEAEPQAAVPGATRDPETGAYFIKAGGDKRFLLFVDKDQDNRVYFYDPETKESQWEDPRGRKPQNANKERTTRTKKSSTKAVPPAPPAPSDKIRLAFVASVPVMLFILGVAARIYYLHVHHPELLFPIKDRRDRRRSGAKFKPQKARGKMSQDGKGGRSANS